MYNAHILFFESCLRILTYYILSYAYDRALAFIISRVLWTQCAVWQAVYVLTIYIALRSWNQTLISLFKSR